jgi:phage-related protein
VYEIVFFKDSDGNEPVKEYIVSLAAKSDKDSRIKTRKILDYIDYLSEAGQSAGEPYIKHIEGAIWELRPLRDRIFFAAWQGDKFMLLHHFMKKTQKTQQREIDTAKRRYEEAIRADGEESK